jgi:hypothetical protein
MNKDLSGSTRTALAMVALFAVRCGGDTPNQSSAIEAPMAGGAGPAAASVAGSKAVGASGMMAAAMGGSANPGTVANAGRSAQPGQGDMGASAIAGTVATAAAGQASVAGASAVGAAGAMAAGAGAAGSGAATAGAWPTADVGADGPFKQMTMTNVGPSNGYQLSYPVELGRDGLKHPIVTWGNGAGSTPNQYTLLQRMATHGFVVIASNSSSVTAALLKGGIDWLIMENGRDGSMFKDKLDPNQVASMGYSLGSLATFEAATDPRIKTTVHISGGSMTKSVVANLHGPAAFYCGTSDDIAYNGCEGDFEITKVPTIYANFPGDHLGVRNMATAPMIAKATVGWLRWRLMGDKSLDAMFVGSDCTLCKDSMWDKVQQKMLDVPPP